MIEFCIFGAMRIGKLNATNAAANPRARMISVVDATGALAAV